MRALHDCDGLVEQASEEELADAAARADRTGLFNCPHTGVALACLIKLVQAGTIARHERVVVISTAHGLKFAEFKGRYHEGQLGFAGRFANAPVRAEATLASAIQIGAPVSLPRAVRALHDCDGLVEQASEEELADAAARAA